MKNVLIVDDNQDILNALANNLCGFLKDCNILTAKSGKHGRDILSSVQVDVVIADLNKPIENSCDFIEWTKNKYPNIRFCVMTGDDCSEVRAMLESFGISRIIHKPFPYDTFAATVRDVLGEKNDNNKNLSGWTEKLSS